MARQPKLATAILPAELSQEIATTGSGRDITRTWTTMLQQPKDRRILGAVDWGAYDEIRKDDQVKSCMQQRILAVISAEWDVVAGDDEDPRSVAAADALKTNLAKIGIDAVTEKMAWLTFYGYQVAEIIWGEPDDGLIPIAQIKVRHARRFRYDKDGLLRLVTRAAPLGELLPDRKFWVAVAGATNDDEPYGEGLADWLYWPTFFKRNGIRFWNIFLDKFGTPTAKATYRRGTPAADIAKIVQALRAMATDSGIVVPEGTAIELLQAARSGTGDFEKLCRYMDEAIAKIILSQTMTTQDGASLSQAQVHAGVKLEVVKADGDLICESFNAGPAQWWSNLNFGPEVAAPRLVRLVEEEADLKMMAETDTVLESQGWVRTEESFTDTYGNGYERKPPSIAGADAPSLVGPTATPLADAAPANDNLVPDVSKPALPASRAAASFAATDPRPLYVYRTLKNARELLAWAKAQGFTSTVPAADLHCTIAYSKRAVDWFKMGNPWGPDASGQLIVAAGGPRLVAALGGAAAVLHFSSADIEWRHENMVDAGASWDFREFQPHVTISYDGAPADLSLVEPYQGKLVFGPEIFEPIDDDWQSSVAQASFAERDQGDVIDEIAGDLLAAHGWRPLSPQLSAIIAALEAGGDVKSIDEALLQSLDKVDADALTMVIARAGFATRLAAEAGEDNGV